MQSLEEKRTGRKQWRDESV